MLCKFFSSVNYYYGWFECFIYEEVNFLCVVNNMYVCGVCIVKKKRKKKKYLLDVNILVENFLCIGI